MEAECQQSTGEGRPCIPRPAWQKAQEPHWPPPPFLQAHLGSDAHLGSEACPAVALLVQLQAQYGISAGTARTRPISLKASTLVLTKCQAPEGVGRHCFRRQGTPSPKQKASSLAAQHAESCKEKVAEAAHTNNSRPGRTTFCLARREQGGSWV